MSHDPDIPDFESPKLPEFLLHNVDEKDRYLLEQAQKIDKIGKTVEWLAETLVKQSEVLAQIEDQVKKTNGRTSQNEKEIVDFKNKLGDWNKQESDFWIAIHKFSKNKWTWITVSFCVCFFTFGIVPWINANGGISEFLGSAIKYFLE